MPLHPSPQFTALACLAVLTFLAGPAGAQLADKSPFLPPAGAVQPSSTGSAGGLELRGIMSTPQGDRYCLYDPVKKTSHWVAVNEAGPAVIKSADPQHDTVVLSTGDGMTTTLQLKKPKVVTGAVPAPQPAPVMQPGFAAPPPGQSPALTNVVLKPTPEDEQRRLQAIADEVRRRRLLREQGQQAQPGAPGSSTAGPPGMVP